MPTNGLRITNKDCCRTPTRKNAVEWNGTEGSAATISWTEPLRGRWAYGDSESRAGAVGRHGKAGPAVRNWGRGQAGGLLSR
jgi:hypothetical protein